MNYKHNNNILQIGTRNTQNTHVTYGTKGIYENGTYDISDCSKVYVNIEDHSDLFLAMRNKLVDLVDYELTLLDSSYIFSGRTDIKHLILAGLEDVTQMNAFANMTKLEYIYLPSFSHMNHQAKYMFKGSSLQEYIQAGDMCEYIDTVGMFQNCKKLKRVIMNPNPRYSMNAASLMFDGCTSLETIVILTENGLWEVSGKLFNDNTTNPITEGTGYVYVHKEFIEQYEYEKANTQYYTLRQCNFRAIEDYPDICALPEAYLEVQAEVERRKKYRQQ